MKCLSKITPLRYLITIGTTIQIILLILCIEHVSEPTKVIAAIVDNGHASSLDLPVPKEQTNQTLYNYSEQ